MQFLLPPTIALTLLVMTSAPARADDPLVEKVRMSIRQGKDYLLGQQRDNGSWEINAADVGHPGGATSLALLALLTSGVSPQNDRIQKGLEYLRKIKPSQTYVVALQTMALAQAGQKDRELIQRNVDWLLKAQQDNGWSYTNQGGVTDNSNTQYAVLGLHAGIEAGVTIDKNALAKIRAFMLRTQQGDGWSYKARGAPMMTMTCAGLCNLMITGMDLDVSKQHMEGGEIKDCGQYDENGPVANALRWIGGRFPAVIGGGNLQAQLGPWPFYCLYGVERTGRLTGQRFLGGHDWYEIGCRYLVGIQKAGGHWQGDNADGTPVLATSFALLFLAKGRTPVLLTKLAYGNPNYTGWNNKHSDARHLVEFASRELFKRQPLAWQIFDARSGVKADNEADRRRLQAAEAEIECARKPRARKPHRVDCVYSDALNCRSTGIRQAQQTSYFVERLACCVVASCAEQAVAPPGFDVEQHRMPSRNQQRDVGELDLPFEEWEIVYRMLLQVRLRHAKVVGSDEVHGRSHAGIRARLEAAVAALTTRP